MTSKIPASCCSRTVQALFIFGLSTAAACNQPAAPRPIETRQAACLTEPLCAQQPPFPVATAYCNQKEAPQFSLTLTAKLDGTNQELPAGGFVPAGATARLHIKVEAQGKCHLAVCTESICDCASMDYYNTATNVDWWTGGEWVRVPLPQSGQGVEGDLVDFTYSPVLISGFGRWDFRIRARMLGQTPCGGELPPPIERTISLFSDDDRTSVNGGEPPCQSSVGLPVNVTDGNVYLAQTDFKYAAAPGLGTLALTRSYNSLHQDQSVFGGIGWTSILDEYVYELGPAIQITFGDGTTAMFGTDDPDPFPDSGFTIFRPLQNRPGTVKRDNSTGLFEFLDVDGSRHQFSQTNRLISITDRNGHAVEIVYDGGKIVSLRDSSGHIVSVVTTDFGLIQELTDATGSLARYTYDDSFRLSRVDYPDGSAFQYTYERIGFRPRRTLLTEVRDALDNVVEKHEYDTSFKASTSETAGGLDKYRLDYVSPTETDVTDGLGRVSKFHFRTRTGVRNLVTSVEGPCSCQGSANTSWEYDTRGNVAKRTNSLGQDVLYTYDSSNRVLTRTDARGTTTYTRNVFGEILTAVDDLGTMEMNQYDENGNLRFQTDARGFTWAFVPDGGLLRSVTDPLGNITRYNYDSPGNLIEITTPNRDTFAIARNGRGFPVGYTDPLGQTTRIARDPLNRPTEITYPDNTTSAIEYDLAGRLASERDRRGNTTRYQYDIGSRLSVVTNADGTSRSFAYDAMSRHTSTTDELGRTTDYEYDNQDRLSRKVYPPAMAGAARLQEGYMFDSIGLLRQAIDAGGRVTIYDYDPANRLAHVTDPAARIQTYEYDGRSRPTAFIDSLGQRTEFGYEATGQLRHRTRAGSTLRYEYDDDGRLLRRSDDNGAITSYAHDSTGNLTSILYPNGATVQYQYDAVSLLTSATNENGTVSISRDALGRPKAVTDVFGKTISYEYDPNGNVSTLSLPPELLVAYQYDSLNRLTQVDDGAGGVATFRYDNGGRRTTRDLPNGVRTGYTFDDLDRIVDLSDAKGAEPRTLNRYEYESLPRIRAWTNLAGSRVLDYNDADELTSVTGSSSETYAYDAVGNRTSSHRSAAYSYSPFNRLETAGDVSLSYGNDKRGNPVSRADSQGTWTYTWDFDSRLVAASASDGRSVQYRYDALGRLVKREPSVGPSTSYTYDGANVILDTSSNGSVVTYVNGLGIDEKLWQTRAGAREFFSADHLGSVSALTDGSGDLLESRTYDAYGNGAPSTRTRFGFTGRELDDMTGLMFYRARWYDPVLGRFLTEDPLGLEAGANLYAYVQNAPTNYTDPWGELQVAAGPVIVIGGGSGLAIVGGLLVVPTFVAAALYYGHRAAQQADAEASRGYTQDAARDIEAFDDNPEPQPNAEGDDGDSCNLEKYCRDLCRRWSHTKGKSDPSKGKAIGTDFEDAVKGVLEAAGRNVTKYRYMWTPYGPRYIDLDVSDAGGSLGGVEVKFNQSRHHTMQRLKDEWLRQYKGYVVNQIRCDCRKYP
jgi:RHS repeat-associated protein